MRVIHESVDNPYVSAIGESSIVFGDITRLGGHSRAPELVEPWNVNADAIGELQATVIELTQRVWALEDSLAKLERSCAANRS